MLVDKNEWDTITSKNDSRKKVLNKPKKAVSVETLLEENKL